tara:strand:+ start:472 stop:957 length:486 start_codon:yes stop_codon:yes gene_type:complete
MVERNPFDAPVAGQSLTDTPKNYSWENPPRFSDVNDSTMFVWKKLNEVDTLKRVLVLLEAGVSVESVTKVIVFSGFVEGAYSVDASLLISPIVNKMIFAIGKAAGVENIKLTNPKKNETEETVQKLLNARGYQPSKKDVEAAKKVIQKKPKGLMSKEEEKE